MTSSALQVKQKISSLSGELTGTIANAAYNTPGLSEGNSEESYVLLANKNKATSESISKWNIPGIQDFRLTFKSGSPTMLPVNLTNLTQYNSTGTIYFTPHKGNQVSLWSTTNGWVIHETDEITISLATTSNDTIYDMFLYDTGSSLAVELSERTHVRGSVSNATSSAHNEKITLSTPVPHGLAVGDTVAVRGVGGKTGANGIQIITDVAGTSFSFYAYDPTAYTAGGHWTKLNVSMVSMTYKDGVRVKSSDNRKRFIGTVATGAAKGITGYNPHYDYTNNPRPARCLLWNENNRIQSALTLWWEDGFTVAPIVEAYSVYYRCGNNNNFQFEFLSGANENVVGGGVYLYANLSPYQQYANYIVTGNIDASFATTGTVFGTNKLNLLGQGGSSGSSKPTWSTSEYAMVPYTANNETKYEAAVFVNGDNDPSGGSVTNVIRNLNGFLSFWW